MLQAYSLQAKIDEFFATHAPISRQQCEEYAASLAGSPVNATPIQGSFSYTVLAGPNQMNVIQFRDSALDVDIIAKARLVHSSVVPSTTSHGILGDPRSSHLFVYEMDKVPGRIYVEGRDCNEYMAGTQTEVDTRRLNTARDFARFFAESWTHRQTLSADQRDALYRQQDQDLDQLSQSLPSRFSSVLAQIRTQLPLLYHPSYPLSLAHDDLSETNMLIDAQTGHLTGIIDWADAKVVPFGFAVWGFFNVTGYMASTGWHFYPNAELLKQTFWEVLEESAGNISDDSRGLIRASCTIGVFLRYGFRWIDAHTKIPVGHEDSSIRYLDALLLGEEAAMDSFVMGR